MKKYDVIIVGGGQSGLAVARYLRRANLRYVILDAEDEAGGAWLHTWNSLRLFSPAKWSSLPGIIMSGGPNYYPTRDETVEYLGKYEKKYKLETHRPVWVKAVTRKDGIFQVDTSDGMYEARALVSATGTFRHPNIPDISGMNEFDGTVIHSSEYRSPEQFKEQKVAVVGGGNSGAQILAEVSKVADTIWITKEPPDFLPDDVDGRYLFDIATKMYEAKRKGEEFKAPSLGDIVMVDPVKDARDRGVLKSESPSFHRLSTDALVWQNGREEKADAVIFCTGFKPALQHLRALGIVTDGNRIQTDGTRATAVPGLWLVGYGNWTGFASATLIGVGRSARSTADEIVEYLEERG